jgi:membrane protease YdiL (CAAX protease family)
MIPPNQNQEKFDFSLKNWIIVFIIIELIWAFGGSLLTYYTYRFFNLFGWAQLTIIIYITNHLNFILLLLLLLYFIKEILKVDLVSYLTNSNTFRWSLFFKAFLIWFSAMLGASLLLFVFKRELFVFQKSPFRVLFIIIALLLTPIQAFSEELLFRATIWRMLDSRVSKKIIISIIGALLFSLAHIFNSELLFYPQRVLIFVYYLLSGFLFMEITIRSGGTESTIAAHIANNLFIAIFVNYTNSSLASESFFIQRYPILAIDFLILFVCSLLILKISKSSKIVSFD